MCCCSLWAWYTAPPSFLVSCFRDRMCSSFAKYSSSSAVMVGCMSLRSSSAIFHELFSNWVPMASGRLM